MAASNSAIFTPKDFSSSSMTVLSKAPRASGFFTTTPDKAVFSDSSRWSNFSVEANSLYRAWASFSVSKSPAFSFLKLSENAFSTSSFSDLVLMRLASPSRCSFTFFASAALACIMASDAALNAVSLSAVMAWASCRAVSAAVCLVSKSALEASTPATFSFSASKACCMFARILVITSPIMVTPMFCNSSRSSEGQHTVCASMARSMLRQSSGKSAAMIG
mmetsp:Transcript_82769/g.146173  ORF Transcript_82769/g.146173 Transcript_82769/m.146173 type:complete len:220 (+) Transcript_82769:505-1164(+)